MSPDVSHDAVTATSLWTTDSFAPAFHRSVLAGAVVGGALAMTAAGAQPVSRVQELAPVTVQGQAPSAYQAPDSVSSPKMTAPLLDTPRSVTVISEEVIKDRGATSLQDVLRTTPGITLGSGEGGTPNGDRPFVRGYEASTDIFIDGVRDYARGSHETFNLESVEVIKGPSSAYTGRGGTGGSINLQTKSPQLENFIEGSAGFGNAGQWRTTVDANRALTETSAVRLNLMKMGGEVPGRDGVTVDRWGVAPSIAFGLNTPTRAILSYSHIENNDMPDLGIPFNNPARPDRVTPPKVDRDNFYGRHNTDFRENVFDTGTVRIEHDVTPALTVRNITRYSRSLNNYLMSRPTFENCAAGDGPPCSDEGPDAQFDRKDRARWRLGESLVNQTDLYGEFRTGTLKHSFSTGVEFGKEDVYSRAVSGTPYAGRRPARELDSLYHPNPGGTYDYNLIYGPRTQDGDIKTRSVYVMDTIDLNDAWSVNLGLRYDNFRVANTSTSRTDSFFNYQAGVVYKPARNGSVYLSYATSSNPSGENLGQAGGADGPAGGAAINDLKPERSRSWELGTKWDVLDDALSLTAAVFQTSKTDARTADPLTGDVTLNGSNRVRGFEMGASGAITPKWQVWAGYSYLDPKIDEYRSRSEVFDGNQIKFIARHSGSLWTTYDILPAVTVGGGVTYQGMRYANDANTLELPSYWRYDAMARYQFNRQLSFQFNVNNISDTEIYDASHVGVFANVGTGRSYMLSATYRFE